MDLVISVILDTQSTGGAYAVAATLCRAWDPALLLESGAPPVVMHAMKLGKSFSSAMAANRREHQRHAPAGGADDSAPRPSPAHTHYTSIGQFQQRVELYHGR